MSFLGGIHNDTSKVKQAESKRAELEKLSGAKFDKAYADNEVAYHKTVDNALQRVKRKIKTHLASHNVML